MANRRHSAEERAAAFYRVGVKPSPPADLTVAAKRIWRRIIDSKPSDWFDADQLQSLAIHCENRAMLNELTRRMAREDVGSDAFKTLAANQKLIHSAVDVSARRLRLTVQNTVERQSRKLGERGSPATKNSLIGGAAIKRVA